MHKNNFIKNINIIKFTLKEIHNLNHWILPVTVFDAFFKSLAPFVNIYMSAKIIDELLGAKDKNTLMILVGITIAANLIVHLISSGLSHMRTIFDHILNENQNMRLNKKIMNMDYEYVENPKVHSIRTKIMEAQNMYGGGILAFVKYIGDFIKGFITVLTSIILVIDLFKPNIASGSVSFVNSYLFSYIFLIILFIGTIVSLKFTTKSENSFFKFFNKIMDVNRIFSYYADIVENYNFGKDIRLYNQKNLIMKEIDKFNKDSANMFNQIGGISGKYTSYNALIASLSSGIIYVFVGLKAIAGVITIGSIVKYVGSINQFMNGSREVLSSFNNIINNNKYIKLYIDFLNIKGDKYKGTLPVEKRNDDEYEVEFKNVSFKYPDTEVYALKNVSIKLKIGERLAIVGMNGSGKTTFIKLLCRLYDPCEGEILLNGINIKKYNYREYLSLFSIVFQDFKLFSFSLGQNVASSVEYDESCVKNVLEKVGFKDRLSRMSNSVKTVLYKDFDDNGVEISGGEAQKIAMARALYRDAPLIILDEPTAALDPISEFEIYSKFNEIVGTKTAFYISHRLSSCRFCDEIAVFDEGKIIQKGKHEELLKDKNNKYYELWNAQAKYYNKKESA